MDLLYFSTTVLVQRNGHIFLTTTVCWVQSMDPRFTQAIHGLPYACTIVGLCSFKMHVCELLLVAYLPMHRYG